MSSSFSLVYIKVTFLVVSSLSLPRRAALAVNPSTTETMGMARGEYHVT
jgi:hypothetical protein